MNQTLLTYTTIDGTPVPHGEATISVFDNALLYAEGLFETFLTIDERVIFIEDHLRRLYRGARVLGLKIPVPKQRLIEWIRYTIAGHPNRVKKLRLTITKGESARWVGRQGSPHVILSASPHTIPEQPFRLWLSDYRVDQDSVFRRIKTVSYAIHAAALNQAFKHKCDDALLLNERGKVAEVTSANIFWVKRGRMYTPPLSAGCLEGVTRKHVMREASRLGFNVSERACSLESLYDAEEVFISSSLKLVVGVAFIKAPGSVRKTRSGAVCDSLRAHFRQLVRL